MFFVLVDFTIVGVAIGIFGTVTLVPRWWVKLISGFLGSYAPHHFDNDILHLKF